MRIQKVRQPLVGGQLRKASHAHPAARFPCGAAIPASRSRGTRPPL